MIVRSLGSALMGALLLALLPPNGQAQNYSNMKDNLIFHYCSKAMEGEFNKAAKTPPQGMVAFTCNCVVQQVDSRASIPQAKAICQAQAQQKFSVQ